MIAIIDYGCGNLNAFTNSFKRLNVKSKIISKSEDLDGIKKIILPGVGSFDYVIKSFNNSGLREMVEKKVINDKIDVLGVCAGMQIMANSSEEGKETGLGWIAGKVKLIKKEKLKAQLNYLIWDGMKLFIKMISYFTIYQITLNFILFTLIISIIKMNPNQSLLLTTLKSFHAQFEKKIFMVFNSILKKVIPAVNSFKKIFLGFKCFFQE